MDTSRSIATPEFRPLSTIEKRDRLFEAFAGIVPRIALAVARGLPPSFDCKDLEQAGMIALLEAAPGVESYLRTRIHGAMVDTIRGRNYKEATHLDTANLGSMAATEYSVLSRLIDEEEKAAVRNSVKCLPPAQAQAIGARFGECRAGRPRSSDAVAERKAINQLRVALAA